MRRRASALSRAGRGPLMRHVNPPPRIRDLRVAVRGMQRAQCVSPARIAVETVGQVSDRPHTVIDAVDEDKVLGKLIKRIVPFLFICYVVSYLDRVNVGFAALTMNKDIGLTPTAFGIGAGLFFFGYFIAEIPSNLIMM